jgi:hypothetical protein
MGLVVLAVRAAAVYAVMKVLTYDPEPQGWPTPSFADRFVKSSYC